MKRLCAAAFLLLTCLAASALAQAACGPDGIQASGSKFRICMPPADQYNGSLVIWAHGFQDAGTPVSIPEDQLCIGGFCIPELVNALGFGFATNSYSKTGLAVLQGKADIRDLVDIYTALKGRPHRVYLVGASEGGIITALSVEQNPDVFSAGLAACGPIGSFPYQLLYFGDARATFQYFFPGVIPGDPFNPPDTLVQFWSQYYDALVKPVVMAPANRHLLDQWVAVANLPYDAGNYLATVEVSVQDVLRYSVVNLKDAAATLGGFPYDNRTRWYTGSDNDLLLNGGVIRVAADAAAVTAMTTSYETTGRLQRPLVTLHTLRDQQVPFLHEQLYDWKTLLAGTWLTRHVNIPIDRFEHCNFTPDEMLFAFILMLAYDGQVQMVSGLDTVLSPAQVASFGRMANAYGIPYSRAGAALTLGPKRDGR
jgi:pimeloyl-ACP methyl ester carboxylesterase